MGRIVKRNVRFWLGSAAYSIITYLLVVVAILFFQILWTPADRLELVITRFPLVIVWGGVVLLMIFQINVYQMYIFQALSNGSRRIEAFWGSQAMNLFTVAVFMSLYLISLRIAALCGYDIFISDIGNVIILSWLILAVGIGSVLGYCIVKLGSKGIILQVIIFALIGGSMGFIFSLFSHDTGFVLDFLKKEMLGMITVSIAVYLIGALVEYRMLKNYEVRC